MTILKSKISYRNLVYSQAHPHLMYDKFDGCICTDPYGTHLPLSIGPNNLMHFYFLGNLFQYRLAKQNINLSHSRITGVWKSIRFFNMHTLPQIPSFNHNTKFTNFQAHNTWSIPRIREEFETWLTCFFNMHKFDGCIHTHPYMINLMGLYAVIHVVHTSH